MKNILMPYVILTLLLFAFISCTENPIWVETVIFSENITLYGSYENKTILILDSPYNKCAISRDGLKISIQNFGIIDLHYQKICRLTSTGEFVFSEFKFENFYEEFTRIKEELFPSPKSHSSP